MLDMLPAFVGGLFQVFTWTTFNLMTAISNWIFTASFRTCCPRF